MFARLGINPGPILLGSGVALLAAGWFIHQRRHGWAFVMTGLTIALSAATVAIGLYPRVMVSSLNPAWSLTIHNAASGPDTLRLMTIVALIFVPIVLIYQGWSYWHSASGSDGRICWRTEECICCANIKTSDLGIRGLDIRESVISLYAAAQTLRRSYVTANHCFWARGFFPP
jgi:hypothetical protein